jgi:hypothetical protein
VTLDDPSLLSPIRRAERQTGIGKTQKDEAENGLTVLGRGQTAIGSKLIGGGPEAFFERRGGEIFGRRRNPVHFWRFRTISPKIWVVWDVVRRTLTAGKTGGKSEVLTGRGGLKR